MTRLRRLIGRMAGRIPQPERWRLRLGWCALGALGAALCISWFSAFSYPLGPFEVAIRVQFGAGPATEFALPPLGTVAARTHPTPLLIAVALQSVDLPLLQQFASDQSSLQSSLDALNADIRKIVRYFSVRVLLLGLIGAGVAVALVERRRHLAPALLSGWLATIFLLAGIGAATWLHYDIRAFAEPDFSGALRSAPWMLELVEEALLEADHLAERMTAIAGSMSALFAQVRQLQPVVPSPGDQTVLVVADIHTHPAAIGLIRGIVEAFEPAFVIDAGDLTDWGTPWEARLLQELASLPVPYLLVPGNHESPFILAQLAQAPNVILLEYGTVEVAGVTVAGIADPGARHASPRVDPIERQATANALAAMMAALEAPPDILVVHQPQLALPWFGRVPIVIAGHLHQPALQVSEGSVYLNPGSAGAAGLRGLERGTSLPYTLALLHLDKSGDGIRAVAVDQITVSHVTTGFTIERRLIDGGDSP